ncbi:hypothetical protein BV22DRAFT_1132353 [Leucogyrophana mollusca]|uniref:Uncharacterized protein n=1 Tax=Leucogyrophana mollusca TaxID=85980 RepID=A0ACB8B7A1_9AGAM|nr:hypothetical protein BV22DRAFT_1132353 [Leucogyrophana mollusca]
MDLNNAEANSRLGFVEELLFLGEGEETGHSDDENPAPEGPSMAPDSESGSSVIEHAYGSGKNICVNFLMGICKFGDTKCVFSHTKDYLRPKGGWWTTQEGRDNAKEVQKLQQQQDRQTEAFIDNYILNLRDSLQPVRQDRGCNGPGSSKIKVTVTPPST